MKSESKVEKDTVTPLPSLLPTETKQPKQGYHFWQYCVNCGTLLEGRKCKLFCPKCGFYHSCSEP